MPFKFHIDSRGLINYLLLPLAVIFYILSSIRRTLYTLGIFKSYASSTPVIIVGNITTGGTGKTPVVIEIVKFLQAKNLIVGVISRGYGRENKNLVVVDSTTQSIDCGDEPKLIYSQTLATVVVSDSKVEAVKAIENQVDVIISDDGLQHYALQRTIEVVVFNGFSNGFYLPAGGLREGKNRLKTVDIVINNADKKIIPLHFVNAQTGEKYPLDYFNDKACNNILAMCGIANPQRFFATLTELGIDFQTRTFKDHHTFTANDFNHNIATITTAKDWVKYSELDLDNLDNIYYLEIQTQLNTKIFQQIENKLC